jgi:hypothetical protein
VFGRFHTAQELTDGAVILLYILLLLCCNI